MKKIRTKLLFLVFVVFSSVSVYAQENLEKNTLSSTGEVVSNQKFKLTGTLGQAFVGRVKNTQYANQAGFWFAAGRIALGNRFADLPVKFELYQNYPNPFNPQTNIKFNVPKSSNIKLEIFNMLGQRVAILVDGKMEPGLKVIKFDAHNLSSGIYVYSLKTGNFAQFKKMMILK